MFACLFCIRDGKTTEESDATVFYNTKTLFAHLSRHPRPLPQVPGLTVVDQETVPYELECDFDLHFPNPPAIHPVQEHIDEVKTRPTGVAIQTVRKMAGQRVLLDGSPAHEVAFGSKLVGITWPARYHGDWIFCWHNGQWASIPANSVQINGPSKDMIKLDITSQTQAKALWKWSPRDGKGWLKFEKGDVITNISCKFFCPYDILLICALLTTLPGRSSDQWFWSGSTAKGKWGIFPHDFIDTSTIQEIPQAGNLNRTGTSLSFERKNSVFSRFGPKSITGRSEGSGSSIHS